ncbi:MAG: hypothetical protein ACLTNP_01475 [Streptococcus salivarius]
MTAALVKADTSKLVTVSDEVFVPLAASGWQLLIQMFYTACEY